MCFLKLNIPSKHLLVENVRLSFSHQTNIIVTLSVWKLNPYGKKTPFINARLFTF